MFQVFYEHGNRLFFFKAFWSLDDNAQALCQKIANERHLTLKAFIGNVLAAVFSPQTSPSVIQAGTAPMPVDPTFEALENCTS